MSQLATYHELSTVYGTEDLLDLLEMLAVKVHNDRELAARAAER